MSMFIEVFSQDVDIHGDDIETEAKMNLIGWPFNLDFSEAAECKVSAFDVFTDTLTEEETLTQLECESDGSFVTIRFTEPIPGGEARTVRLRVKVFV